MTPDAALYSPVSSYESSPGKICPVCNCIHPDFVASSGSEDCDAISTMATGDPDDINVVLDQIIFKMNRISEHLRKQGQNEAANRLTREMTTTFQCLVDVIAHWNTSQCLMAPIVCQYPPLAPLPVDGPPPPLPYSSNNRTWAAVTAIAPANSDGAGIVKYSPVNGIKCEANTTSSPQNHHPEHDRVVWVQPWSASRSLKEITEEVRSASALYSIVFSPDENAVCVIFQRADCAAQFLAEYGNLAAHQGYGSLGEGVSVFAGQPFPANIDIKRMEMPWNERRRLTFARQQLFTQASAERSFRQELEKLVGKSNIEVVHLFNTGNATVVLTSVPCARLVKQHFSNSSRDPKSQYYGVMVSFSHDPCEKQLHLVSQFGGQVSSSGLPLSTSGTGQHTRSNTQSSGNMNWRPEYNGGGGGGGGGSSWRPVHERRRSSNATTKVENNGWQTVGRKK